MLFLPHGDFDVVPSFTLEILHVILLPVAISRGNPSDGYHREISRCLNLAQGNPDDYNDDVQG